MCIFGKLAYFNKAIYMKRHVFRKKGYRSSAKEQEMRTDPVSGLRRNTNANCGSLLHFPK